MAKSMARAMGGVITRLWWNKTLKNGHQWAPPAKRSLAIKVSFKAAEASFFFHIFSLTKLKVYHQHSFLPNEVGGDFPACFEVTSKFLTLTILPGEKNAKWTESTIFNQALISALLHGKAGKPALMRITFSSQPVVGCFCNVFAFSSPIILNKATFFEEKQDSWFFVYFLSIHIVLAWYTRNPEMNEYNWTRPAATSA